VNPVRVRITRVRGERDADLPLPSRRTAASSGYDLAAGVDTELEIQPGERVRIPTGFAIAIPPGYEGQVRPRSGLALKHGVTLINAPGTIDSDYRGELSVILWNAGDKAFRVCRGDRVGQLVIAPVADAEWEPVEDVAGLGETERGDGGFGSTGRS
jgi:dUTP pyrophosphatase